MAHIGERIRKFREAHGLTQEEFAARVGADQSIISQYENGLIKNPGAWLIENIVKAFPINAFWLLTGGAQMDWRGSRAPLLEKFLSRKRIEEEMRGKLILNLLYMAAQILDSSDEDYSRALEQNIRAFFKAVKGGSSTGKIDIDLPFEDEKDDGGDPK